MKGLPVPPVSAEIRETIRRLIHEGKSREAVFTEMRRLGLFMGFSIKLAHELYGISLIEAKEAVHFSETWADCREATTATHESAIGAAWQLGFTEVELDPHSEPAELLERGR